MAGCRRVHRGRQAGRRNATRRRRIWRRRCVLQKQEEGRSTAAAALQSADASLGPGGARWQTALSILRWRRMQAVWIGWMVSQASESSGAVSARGVAVSEGGSPTGLGRVTHAKDEDRARDRGVHSAGRDAVAAVESRMGGSSTRMGEAAGRCGAGSPLVSLPLRSPRLRHRRRSQSPSPA